MRQLKIWAAACMAALALSACDTDTTNEQHGTSFYPLTVGGIETYCDQTVDSVRVMSFDSWTLDNTSDWCTMSAEGQKNNISIQVPAGYISSTRLDFRLQPNNTGKLRATRIEVKSSYAKIGTVATTLSQYPHHNITSPAGQYGTGNEYSRTFSLNVPAEGVNSYGSKPYVKFTVYAEGATLTASEEWLVPEKTGDFKPNQQQLVDLTVQPNLTTEQREAELSLSSAGVKTVIRVTQAGQPKVD